MKKLLCIFAASCILLSITPALAAPHRGPHRGGMGRPHGGMMRPPMGRPMGGVRPMRPHHHGIHRIPPRPIGHVRPLPPPPPPRIYRPYRPIWYLYYPYQFSIYYPRYYPATYSTTYTYYPYTSYMSVSAGISPIAEEIGTYAGINTAAYIINTAANVASTIKYLSR